MNKNIVRSHKGDGKLIIFLYSLGALLITCWLDINVHKNITPARDDLCKRKLDCCELCRRSHFSGLFEHANF